MTTTPTDLDGNPYIPETSYSWMTDAHRATCAHYANRGAL